MATKTKQWPTGTGSATIQYGGQGDGQITITSDPNSVYEARSMQITVETTDGSGISRTVTIQQAAKQRIDLSAAVVTASNQTYNGSAKTPTPTVTLNGTTIPSSGYDVAYSDNTNAGAATITVTGKGAYTGTAYGTFTINKATPSYTAPTYRTLTYNGGNQYLTTTGSTNDGTIKYSLDGVNWYTTRRQGSTAGTYTSYWKLEGDSNHTDISSTSISTTIAKASRTLSFADSYMVLNTSSTGTKTATPSAGSGDGAITYSLANTTYATINSSTGTVTSKTSDGSVTVTANIADGTNYLSASATYTLYVFATTHNYSYNGSYRSVTLPPGTYQFQVWGAQGGSNGTNSSYGITAKSGGKGGYSVGQLTISQATGVRVYVGGQGSSSAGGYNGGGSTTETSQYNSGDTFGYSKMGGGGGATDIRLSDGALLSRMIVAGGGSGGAYCYKKVTTSSTQTIIDGTSSSYKVDGNTNYPQVLAGIPVVAGTTYTLIGTGDFSSTYAQADLVWIYNNGVTHDIAGKNYTDTAPDGATSVTIRQFVSDSFVSSRGYSDVSDAVYNSHGWTLTIQHTETTSSTTESSDYQTGFAGGGTNGAGYSSTYQGKQNAAGSGGSFGQGANQTATNYRYCSGAGGGGWYGGGGGQYSDSSMTYCKYSGGGSGFVNTAASAGNRPSGYTGLQLDSGTTYAGNTSFPSTSGGTETGHSGNGYVRITRL